MKLGGKVKDPDKEKVKLLQEETKKYIEIENLYNMQVIGKDYQGLISKPSLEGPEADVFHGLCAVFEKDKIVVEGQYEDMLYGLSCADFIHEDKRIAPHSREHLVEGIHGLQEKGYIYYSDRIRTKMKSLITVAAIPVWIRYNPTFLSHLKYTPLNRETLSI